MFIIRTTIQKITKLNPIFAAIPISLWGIYLRFQVRVNSAYWEDERFQIDIVNRSFREFFDLLPKGDFCGYLNGDYFLIYPFVRIFGSAHWGIIIPHVLLTLVGYWVLYQICRLYLKTFWGFAITFLVFNFNANLILHALEVRPYAVLAVLGMTVFYCLDVLMRQKFKMTGNQKLVYGFIFVFTILFHPYGILIVFFNLAYFILAYSKDPCFKETIRRGIPFLAIVFLIAFPIWYDSIFGAHKSFGKHVVSDVFAFIPNPIVQPLGFLKGVFCNLVGHKANYLFCAGLILSLVLGHPDQRKHLSFLLLLVILPIEVIFLADINNQYWFVQRQFIWIMPLFALLLGWAWESCIFYFSYMLERRRVVKSR